MAEAMKLAEMMASAKLVPVALQKSPADCLMVIQQAVRWQMDPFAVAQECSVIQGKLMHSGKLVAAVVNARGNLEERLSFSYAGEGDKRAITVSGRLRGESAARTVAVKLGDAKTANSMWQKQPDQQLMYHGTRVWARRHTPELMLGVYSPEEEFDEAVNGAQVQQPLAIEHSPIKPQLVEPPHDPETGETGPHEIALPLDEEGKPLFLKWGTLFVAAIKSVTTLDEIVAWEKANGPTLERAHREAIKIYNRITINLNEARAKFAAPADDGIPPALDRRKKAAPTPESPDEWLAHIEKELAACTTLQQLDLTWNDKFLPRLDEMFPPDQDVAKKSYEKHAKRLS